MSRSSCGSTAKTTPTTNAAPSAITRPVRFMRRARSLPRAGSAAGDQPIDQTAGNTGSGKNLAHVREIAAGGADITGEVEAVRHNQRQHAAERAIDDDRAQRKAFRERDQ